MSAKNILENLKGGHSITLTKEEYENIRNFIETNKLPKHTYINEYENETVEQIWFVYNKKQYILYRYEYIFKKEGEKEETFSIYRLF